MPHSRPRRPLALALLVGALLAAGCGAPDAPLAPPSAPEAVAMAAPVLRRGEAIGVISIAGPRARLSVGRAHELAPSLLATAAEFGPISNASSLFGRPPLGKG